MFEGNTLSEALNYVQCTELPKPLRANQVYVRALAKVRKSNNREALCYVINDGSDKPVIKKMFGSVAAISEVMEIYPLSVLKASCMPSFKKKTEVEAFLTAKGENEDYVRGLLEKGTDESKAMLKTLVKKHCIIFQLQQEKMEMAAEKRRLEEAKEAEEKAEIIIPEHTEETEGEEKPSVQTTEE